MRIENSLSPLYKGTDFTTLAETFQTVWEVKKVVFTFLMEVFLFLFVFYVFVPHICRWNEKNAHHIVFLSSLSGRHRCS